MSKTRAERRREERRARKQPPEALVITTRFKLNSEGYAIDKGPTDICITTADYIDHTSVCAQPHHSESCADWGHRGLLLAALQAGCEPELKTACQDCGANILFLVHISQNGNPSAHELVEPSNERGFSHELVTGTKPRVGANRRSVETTALAPLTGSPVIETGWIDHVNPGDELHHFSIEQAPTGWYCEIVSGICPA